MLTRLSEEVMRPEVWRACSLEIIRGRLRMLSGKSDFLPKVLDHLTYAGSLAIGERGADLADRLLLVQTPQILVQNGNPNDRLHVAVADRGFGQRKTAGGLRPQFGKLFASTVLDPVDARSLHAVSGGQRCSILGAGADRAHLVVG